MPAPELTVLIQADDPDVLLLEGVDGLREVGLGDEQVFAGAGRGVDDRGRDLDRARQRNDDAVHADDLGGAQQTAEVLRILKRIEDQDERRLALLLRAIEDIRQIAYG